MCYTAIATNANDGGCKMGLLAFFRKKPANAQPNGEDNALTEIHADISQMDAVELPMAQIAAFGGGICHLFIP